MTFKGYILKAVFFVVLLFSWSQMNDSLAPKQVKCDWEIVALKHFLVHVHWSCPRLTHFWTSQTEDPNRLCTFWYSNQWCHPVQAKTNNQWKSIRDHYLFCIHLTPLWKHQIPAWGISIPTWPYWVIETGFNFLKGFLRCYCSTLANKIRFYPIIYVFVVY